MFNFCVVTEQDTNKHEAMLSITSTVYV